MAEPYLRPSNLMSKMHTSGAPMHPEPGHPYLVVQAVTKSVEAARSNDRKAAEVGPCPTCGRTKEDR